MTPPPDLTPAERAELERRLAHAAAEVARVKEQLGSGAPQAYEPYRPGAPGPEPTVTVDGERVEPGAGRLSEALRAHGFVVEVNGHAFSSDDAALASLDPRLAADLQQTFRMLGMDPPVGRSQERLGLHLPGPDDVDRLVEGPRAVPFTHRLAVGNLNPVGMFVLVLLVVSPFALWILVPGTLAIAICVAALALGARSVLRYRRWVPVLREGEVAQVTAAVASTSTTSFANVPLRRARGWDARWQLYTGPAYRTEVSYTVAGSPGVLVLSGAPYDGGVVLADPRRPARALCVSQLPFSVHPGPDGRLRGGLSPLGWLGVLFTLGCEAAMVAVIVSSVRG